MLHNHTLIAWLSAQPRYMYIVFQEYISTSPQGTCLRGLMITDDLIVAYLGDICEWIEQQSGNLLASTKSLIFSEQ